MGRYFTCAPLASLAVAGGLIVVCASPLLAQAAQPAATTAQGSGASDPNSVWAALLGTVVGTVIGAVVGAVLTYLFTRPMERAKQQEAFKVALVQKRVDTALHVQDELATAIDEFLDESGPCKETGELDRCYVEARRKVIALLGRTIFTNPLIYGYTNGLLHSNMLHDAQKMNAGASCSVARANYRRALRFLAFAYSSALYRSAHWVWELETEMAKLEIIEDMAEADVQAWYDAERDMRNFKSSMETMTTKELQAKLNG